jgi:hypothetical protein
VHINRKVLVVKRTNTPITRGQRYLVATLTRWSFRQQCCRNNGFRRSSIHSIPVRQENRKEWFTPPLVIWFIPYTLKNVFNYEENDIFGVRLILVGLQSFLYSVWPLLNGATTVIFEVPSYPDFSRF